jgi:hypothetical protein
LLLIPHAHPWITQPSTRLRSRRGGAGTTDYIETRSCAGHSQETLGATPRHWLG